MDKRDIGPADVARVLNSARLKYVLVGAHAANGYLGRPRNTVDVDVVVQFPKKATTALAAAFPDLSIVDSPVVTRFKLPNGNEAIGVMKPTGSPLWKELLRITKSIRVDGVPIQIPPLEGVLAAKFAAMVSPWRRPLDKQQDGLDFARMISVNERVDESLLESLAERIFEGGGKEVLKLLADARAGRRLEQPTIRLFTDHRFDELGEVAGAILAGLGRNEGTDSAGR